MRPAFRALALAAAFMAAAPSAFAEVIAAREDCTRPSPDLVAELLDWIEGATDYDVSRARTDPPLILFCDEGDALEYPGGGTLVQPGEGGVYNYQARVIYLVSPWSPDDTWHRSVLLHELIHDVQFLNRTWECPNASEMEAYTLQDDWLKEQGVAHDFDWLAIWFWSKCGDGPHP